MERVKHQQQCRGESDIKGRGRRTHGDKQATHKLKHRKKRKETVDMKQKRNKPMTK